MPARVLLIDDSATAHLRRVLEADASIAVVATSASAGDVLPNGVFDVVVVGLLQGLHRLEQLKQVAPIVVCCANTAAVPDVVRISAHRIVAIPSAVDGDDGDDARRLRVAVLEVWRPRREVGRAAPPQRSSLIVLGASTGGTDAIAQLLAGLDGDVPPMVLVQHMPREHTKRFADRLNRLTSLDVVEAVDGQPLRSNQVLVAPGGRHVQLEASGGVIRVAVRDAARTGPHTPSVDELFHAAARLRDVDISAVILTGMGADGADGMSALRDAGAMTIAQDEASCAVFGMPREAIKRGAAQLVLPLAEIAKALRRWSRCVVNN